MAHLPPESVPVPGDFSKTLFFAPGGEGVLVLRSPDGGMTRKQKSFQDAHAALDWSLANGAVFCCLPSSPDPSKS